MFLFLEKCSNKFSKTNTHVIQLVLIFAFKRKKHNNPSCAPVTEGGVEGIPVSPPLCSTFWCRGDVIPMVEAVLSQIRILLLKSFSVALGVALSSSFGNMSLLFFVDMGLLIHVVCQHGSFGIVGNSFA